MFELMCEQLTCLHEFFFIMVVPPGTALKRVCSCRIVVLKVFVIMSPSTGSKMSWLLHLLSHMHRLKKEKTISVLSQ